jgi:hypothetical protein
LTAALQPSRAPERMERDDVMIACKINETLAETVFV